MGASAGVVDVWMRGGDLRSTTNTPFSKPSRVVVATTLACRIMPSRNGGSSAPTDAVLGVLQLLSEDNKEMHRYNIHKTTTTMGRALTNDVRLLLEDVSRQHCTIEFYEENDAVLHVLGSNGVWHNDVHMKPNSTNGKRIHLANGDKVKISCLLYTSPSPRDRG